MEEKAQAQEVADTVNAAEATQETAQVEAVEVATDATEAETEAPSDVEQAVDGVATEDDDTELIEVQEVV